MCVRACPLGVSAFATCLLLANIGAPVSVHAQQDQQEKPASPSTPPREDPTTNLDASTAPAHPSAPSSSGRPGASGPSTPLPQVLVTPIPAKRATPAPALTAAVAPPPAPAARRRTAPLPRRNSPPATPSAQPGPPPPQGAPNVIAQPVTQTVTTVSQAFRASISPTRMPIAAWMSIADPRRRCSATTRLAAPSTSACVGAEKSTG
jgi:hypothetical protein